MLVGDNKVLRILWTIAAALGAVIAARWLLGPFSLGGIAVNVPLNPEGVFGLLVVLLLAARTERVAEPSAPAGRVPIYLSAVVAFAALNLAGMLWAVFAALALLVVLIERGHAH